LYFLLSLVACFTARLTQRSLDSPSKS